MDRQGTKGGGGGKPVKKGKSCICEIFSWNLNDSSYDFSDALHMQSIMRCGAL